MSDFAINKDRPTAIGQVMYRYIIERDHIEGNLKRFTLTLNTYTVNRFTRTGYWLDRKYTYIHLDKENPYTYTCAMKPKFCTFGTTFCWTTKKAAYRSCAIRAIWYHQKMAAEFNASANRMSFLESKNPEMEFRDNVHEMGERGHSPTIFNAPQWALDEMEVVK